MKKIKQWVKVKVPASTANLGPGYDVLGIALKLYNEVEVFAEKAVSGNRQPLVQIEVQGEGSNALPKDERHVVWQAMKKVFTNYKLPITNYQLQINNYKNLKLITNYRITAKFL